MRHCGSLSLGGLERRGEDWLAVAERSWFAGPAHSTVREGSMEGASDHALSKGVLHMEECARRTDALGAARRKRWEGSFFRSTRPRRWIGTGEVAGTLA